MQIKLITHVDMKLDRHMMETKGRYRRNYISIRSFISRYMYIYSSCIFIRANEQLKSSELLPFPDFHTISIFCFSGFWNLYVT
jgi:hypothetical protein